MILNPTMISLRSGSPSKLGTPVSRVLSTRSLTSSIKSRISLKLSARPTPKKEWTVMILSTSKISRSARSTPPAEKNSLSKVLDNNNIDFVVTHDVTIQVDNTDKIGELGDKLLKVSNTKIDSFDWESEEEDDDEEEAIEAGKEKAEEMCYHLGMKLHRIVSVEDVEDDEDEDAAADEEGDDEDDEDDEDDGPLVYRFEVECKLDAETAAKKEKEEEEEDKQEAAEEAEEKKK